MGVLLFLSLISIGLLVMKLRRERAHLHVAKVVLVDSMHLHLGKKAKDAFENLKIGVKKEI